MNWPIFRETVSWYGIDTFIAVLVVVAIALLAILKPRRPDA